MVTTTTSGPPKEISPFFWPVRAMYQDRIREPLYSYDYPNGYQFMTKYRCYLDCIQTISRLGCLLQGCFVLWEVSNGSSRTVASSAIRTTTTTTFKKAGLLHEVRVDATVGRQRRGVDSRTNLASGSAGKVVC